MNTERMMYILFADGDAKIATIHEVEGHVVLVCGVCGAQLVCHELDKAAEVTENAVIDVKARTLRCSCTGAKAS